MVISGDVVLVVATMATAAAATSTGVRVLQESGNGLCASVSTTTQNSPSVCAEGAQTFGVVEWTPCCALDIRSDDEVANKCRTFEIGGAYCKPGDPCENNLDSNDVFQMSLEFDELDNDAECCRNCVCFGDPECVSFANVEDLWIPCDAREDPFSPFVPTVNSVEPKDSYKACRIHRDICTETKDPNGNQCIWKRDQGKDTNVGWDMAIRGSPCVPDLTKGSIEMNMYTSKQGSFIVDLILGERGIIEQVNLRKDGTNYKLNAQTCFDYIDGYAKQWDKSSLPDSLPDSFYQVKNTTTEIEWQVVDAAEKISMHLLCVRAASNAIARINVQSITVLAKDATKGSGFCVENEILEAGDTAATLKRHHECVASAGEALNACKALVSAGLVDNQLPECAIEWCSKATFSMNPIINAKKRVTCKQMLKGNSAEKNNKWIDRYCVAAQALYGISKNTCETSVKAEGWFYAVKTYGTGIMDAAETQYTCQNSLSEYALDKKEECVDGIYIEVNTGTDGNPEWKPKYFIPVNKPPCNDNVIATTGANSNDKDLFMYPVRVRQCDPVVEDGCNAPLVATCSKTPGANFEVLFNNVETTNARILEKLVEDGKVICVPDNVNDQTNADYDPYHCLPNKESIKTQAPEMCVCPA